MYADRKYRLDKNAVVLDLASQFDRVEIFRQKEGFPNESSADRDIRETG